METQKPTEIEVSKDYKLTLTSMIIENNLEKSIEVQGQIMRTILSEANKDGQFREDGRIDAVNYHPNMPNELGSVVQFSWKEYLHMGKPATLLANEIITYKKV